MSKMVKVLFGVSIFFLLIPILMPMMISGCTSNQMAKEFGGTTNVSIPKDKQFVNITWKEGSSLWVLTCDREEGHQPRKYYFDEKSGWGIVQGSVVISEK